MGFSIKMLTEASSRIVYAARVFVKNKKTPRIPHAEKIQEELSFVRKSQAQQQRASLQ